MLKQLNRFEVRKEWLGIGFTCMFPKEGKLYVYDHDKNYKLWAESVRKNAATDFYSAPETVPTWAAFMKKA